MNNLMYSFGPTYSWPCEYCKEKFIDVRYVINHEINICDKNPKFTFRSDNLEKYLKNNHLVINKCQNTKLKEN
jgi:hypothetical protein